MSENWQRFFLYGDNYITYVRQRANELKAEGKQIRESDLTSFDTLHPAGHYGLDLFLARPFFQPGATILDIGCGLGGVARYLADRGFNVYGIDVLPQFIDGSKELSELVRLSEKTEYHLCSITDTELPKNRFDGGIIITVLILVESRNIFRNIFESFKSGGVLYIEDYCVIKPNPDDDDRRLLNDFCLPGVRTREGIIKELEEVGFQVEFLEDISVQWSEFAWNRAEALWQRKLTVGDIADNQLQSYGTNAPKLLCYMSHLTEAEIRTKYPNTIKAVGIDYIYTRPKLVFTMRIAARKP